MMPLSEPQAKKAIKWMKANFGNDILKKIAGTKYSVDTVCGIFCQETASKLIGWMDSYEPEVILARCVFDASGDFPGTIRYAFPKNREEFQEAYGVELTEKLINEANLQRKMPQAGAPNGWSPAKYLYKGYGIFQYDLQNIKTDPDFFKLKQWYSFNECLDRLIKILNQKAKSNFTIHDIVRAYNGSGSHAEQYAINVMTFSQISTEV